MKIDYEWNPYNGDPVGLAVILPGRNYPATMPLLFFAGKAALEHGWSVRALSWQAPDTDSPLELVPWVSEQLREAVGDFEGSVLVIGKSLGSLAAPYAAEQGYEAIWLTPLLHTPELAELFRGSGSRQILVGGTNDPAWNGEAARSLNADVCEIEDGDHSMLSSSAVRSAAMHEEATRAIDAWLSE